MCKLTVILLLFMISSQSVALVIDDRGGSPNDEYHQLKPRAKIPTCSDEYVRVTDERCKDFTDVID